MGLEEAQLKDILRVTQECNKSLINVLLAGLKDILNKDCVQGVSNEQRVITLEREMVENRVNMKEIKEVLLGRPTWSVTIIISFLLSFSLVCLTMLLKAT